MPATNKQNSPDPTSLVNFPSEVDLDCNLRIYDWASADNQMAVISHYIHNGSSGISADEKLALAQCLLDYIDSKPETSDSLRVKQRINSHEVTDLMEEPQQLSLFSDFFHVPYPNPRSAQFTFIDLFAGIGGIRLPFSEMGYKCVFSSEWDKHAQKSYLANFGEMPFGDICKDSTKSFIPHNFDLLLAGFPCQAFSIMGKMKGFEDTRGTLFFEVASILKEHKPKAFLLENVKQLTTHDHGNTFKRILETLSELGYAYKWAVLNALNFGLPQKRERVIIVGFLEEGLINDFNFDFDKIPYNLKEILESDDIVDQSLFASDAIIQKRQDKTKEKIKFTPSIWHENKSGNISILDHACALRTGASYNYLLVNGVRRPSSRELLRLQGFPDNYRIAVSHSEIRRQTGNSVAVPMVRQIALKINKILTTHYA